MKHTEPRRVVITGMGLVTPLGLGLGPNRLALAAGHGGIARIRAFDLEPYRTTCGGEVDTAALDAALAQIGQKPSDRMVDMALVAAQGALATAALTGAGPQSTPQPVPVIVGTGLGASHSLFEANNRYRDLGPKGVRPTSVPRGMANSVAARLSIHFSLTGPNFAIVSACASSTAAMGQAFRMIRHGYADIVLCGGADAVFDPFAFSCWNNLGVMSKNPDPQRACRPFDTDRDGCVLGEGAGMLVLEAESHAHARRAPILARLAGYGETSDATHITSPSPDGQALAMQQALADAGYTPADIGLVCAHGTATRANDTCEAASIARVLGEHTARVPVFSLKSYIGHLLGASGSVESVLTILGLQDNRVPCNLNLAVPDAECRLNLPVRPVAAPDRAVVLKNSFGFGGHNAVVVLETNRDTPNGAVP